VSRLVDNSDYNLCNIVVGGVFHRYDKAMLWPTNVAGVKLSYIGVETACEIVIGGIGTEVLSMHARSVA
jgi:hypothetical protein